MNRTLSSRVAIGIAVLVLAFTSCSTSPPPLPRAERSGNNLTPGMVQKRVKVGETNQTEVLEVFGAPNIITRDKSGQEVWTYDVQGVSHTEAATSRSGGMAAAAGGMADQVPIVGSLGTKGSKTASTGMVSSSTFTLIVKFDANQVVADYSMRSTSF